MYRLYGQEMNHLGKTGEKIPDLENQYQSKAASQIRNFYDMVDKVLLFCCSCFPKSA